MDLDLVNEPFEVLELNLLPAEEPVLASNNFLVCFTVSGAGISLSFTPKMTPVDALLFEAGLV